ncbi:MAG: O-antigen ligase family protein [Nitrospira sp.]|nr:O-antigen ligase family protein [Nitrospira sp.]MCP9462676.1 O-antigen ligase family protein [Nitrospira sp.]
MVYWGILLFFALEYIRPGSYVPALNALHLNSIVPLSVFLGSLVSRSRVKISEVLSSPNAKWIAYLLFLIVISGLTCDVKQYALNVFEMVLGYCLAYFFLRKEIYTVNRMSGVLATLVLVHVAVGLLTPELFSGDGERHYIASGGFLGDGNDFALSVNITIPFCLFLMLNAQGKIKKLFFTGLLFLLIFAVVATQSRGGILALSSIGFYYWIKSERKILGVIGIGIVILFVLAVAPGQLFDRLATLTKTGEEMEGSAQGRILAWTAAVKMAADNPLLGGGVGHFPVKYGAEYRPAGYGLNEIPWQTAHSSYFLILGELGLPGIVFLVGIIVSNLMANKRMLRESGQGMTGQAITCRNLVIALNASLIGFAVGGAFLSAAYSPHIYILAALLECGRDLYKKSLVPKSAADLSDLTPQPIYRQVPA